MHLPVSILPTDAEHKISSRPLPSARSQNVTLNVVFKKRFIAQKYSVALQIRVNVFVQEVTLRSADEKKNSFYKT
jgi:hypothetical protein